MQARRPAAELDRLLGWLYGVFHGMVGDPEDARDLTHDCALKFLQRLADGERIRNAEAMLRVMARHLAVDYYRRRARQITEQPPAPDQVTPTEAHVAPWLGAVIDELPEKYATALTRVDLEGWTQRRLASHLGLSLSGAKSRVQRARNLLAQRVRAHCTLEFDGEGRLANCIPRELCCASRTGTSRITGPGR